MAIWVHALQMFLQIVTGEQQNICKISLGNALTFLQKSPKPFLKECLFSTSLCICDTYYELISPCLKTLIFVSLKSD